MSDSEFEPLLTAKDVSAMTGVSENTLHEWSARRDRGLPAPGPVHCRLSPRHRRWRRSDVEEWLASTRVGESSAKRRGQ